MQKPPKMGKGGILKTSKLLKVKAKAKCVAKAKAKAKALAATRALKGAQKKAQPKGQSSKPLKGVLKPTKKNLKKLGREASLVEKVQALAKGANTAEEAVSQVQDGLSKLDKSKFHMNNNPEAKEQQEKLGKKAKGAQATLWFLRDKVPQFANFSENREEATTLKKVDKWLSEKEALSKWTEAELEAHCQSGRVQYRECPMEGMGIPGQPRLCQGDLWKEVSELVPWPRVPPRRQRRGGRRFGGLFRLGRGEAAGPRRGQRERQGFGFA